MTVSRTEYPKQPLYSVRDTISETLHELPGKMATTPVPADLLKLKISEISQMSQGLHRFTRSPKSPSLRQSTISHQSIQTFNSLPAPMLLSKHKVQSIQNTQQTVMRYQPFRCNCYKTTQNADPLSSSFSKTNRIKYMFQSS